MKKILYILIILLFIPIAFLVYVRIGIENKTPQSIAPTETQFIQIENGDEIAYQEINNNSPTTVIFVGGLSGWAGTWKRSITELDKNNPKKYNYIALDLPPFGFSTASGSFTRDVQAERINQFRKAKKLEQIIFVGHSYGGGIVVEAVMQNQQGIEKLIIIDGVLNIDENKVVKESFVFKHMTLLEYGLQSVIHINPLIKQRLKGFVYQTQNITSTTTKIYMESFRVRGTGEKFARWIRDYIEDPLVYPSTQSEEYTKLTMPVRIIWGKEDTLTPLELAHQLQKLIPKSVVYELDSVGHIPMIEDYTQFDAALLKSVTE